jgi:mannitol-1-/sugar-/sorbitol-6-phosphatase
MTELFARPFDAFLFDMDGTILNSIAVAERVWGAWARKVGLDPDAFLPTIHGRKATETIAALGLAGIDPQAEAAAINLAEMADMTGIVPISGAIDFLERIPPMKWAIVTSAPADLAKRRIAAAGLLVPPVIITAEDVKNGKPAPDCFLLAAERLAVDPSRCLVFEDAHAGITAAEAAGCQVLVITETHGSPLESDHSRIVNYDGVQLVTNGNVLRLARL